MSAAPTIPLVHAGFVWITTDERSRVLVEHDRELQKWLVVSPEPGLFGCRTKDRDRVVTRLAKLGLAPGLVGHSA